MNKNYDEISKRINRFYEEDKKEKEKKNERNKNTRKVRKLRHGK